MTGGTATHNCILHTQAVHADALALIKHAVMCCCAASHTKCPADIPAYPAALIATMSDNTPTPPCTGCAAWMKKVHSLPPSTLTVQCCMWSYFTKFVLFVLVAPPWVKQVPSQPSSEPLIYNLFLMIVLLLPPK
jgi:hypothetical protein